MRYFAFSCLVLAAAWVSTGCGDDEQNDALHDTGRPSGGSSAGGSATGGTSTEAGGTFSDGGAGDNTGDGGAGGSNGDGGAGGTSSGDGAGGSTSDGGVGGSSTGGSGGSAVGSGGSGGSSNEGGTSAEGGAGGGTGGSGSTGDGGGTSGSAGTGTGGVAATGGVGGTGGTGTGGDGGVGGVGGNGATGGTGGVEPVDCSADEPPTIDRLGLEMVVSDDRFERLIDARQPPGSNDWYLVDQIGIIYIFRDGEILDDPFLDIQDEIYIGAYPFNTAVKYDDRGLVGIEFAPDYAESGLFYLAIIPSADGVANQDADLVREYQRSTADPDLADPAPTRTLLELPAAAEGPGVTFTVMHNTSTLRFGPDGMLYIATGDGGTASCNAAQPNAPQSITSPIGKILRLDLSAPPPYAAADNPFVDVEGADPRVLHYGLRNPFRFGMDSLTGDLYIGDVGQFSYEEVSYAPAEARGLNFGWAAFEGLVKTCPNRAQRAGSTHTEPFFVTDRRRTATGPYSDYVSAIGGPVYRGSQIPELYGAELFGDFEGARMNALFNCGPAPEERSPLTIIRKSCDANYPGEACFVPTGEFDDEFVRLYAIVEGNDHEIYMIINHDSLRKIAPYSD